MTNTAQTAPEPEVDRLAQLIAFVDDVDWPTVRNNPLHVPAFRASRRILDSGYTRLATQTASPSADGLTINRYDAAVIREMIDFALNGKSMVKASWVSAGNLFAAKLAVIEHEAAAESDGSGM